MGPSSATVHEERGRTGNDMMDIVPDSEPLQSEPDPVNETSLPPPRVQASPTRKRGRAAYHDDSEDIVPDSMEVDAPPVYETPGRKTPAQSKARAAQGGEDDAPPVVESKTSARKRAAKGKAPAVEEDDGGEDDEDDVPLAVKSKARNQRTSKRVGKAKEADTLDTKVMLFS